jgi:integrase
MNDVDPVLGHLPMAKITRPQVSALRNKLIQDGRESAARAALVPLRVIYRNAIHEGILNGEYNPTAEVGIPTCDSKRERHASVAEAYALLEALEPHERAIWATAFFSSLRSGELRGLQVEDVDAEHNIIHVERGWDRSDGPIDPKNKDSKREVEYLPQLNDFLIPHLAGVSSAPGTPVFNKASTTPDGRKRRRRGSSTCIATMVNDEVCGRAIYSGEYCEAHYKDSCAGEPFHVVKRQAKRGEEVTCRGPECINAKARDGLCLAHHKQQERGRPLTPLRTATSSEARLRFDPVVLQKNADRRWEAAGLERICLHECRHTYCSKVGEDIVSYADLVAVKKMTGHSAKSRTYESTYMHPSTTTREAIVRRSAERIDRERAQPALPRARASAVAADFTLDPGEVAEGATAGQNAPHHSRS